MNFVFRWTRWPLLVLVVLAFGVGTFARSMEDGLNHDEHQFLAPAVLLARHGLLPFRDYPIFHLPTLSLINAALVSFTDYPFFAAKAFSVLCSTLTAALIGWVCVRGASSSIRSVAGAAAVLCLLFVDPLFDFTTGKIWNHEFPALCLVLALVCIGEMARKGGGPGLCLVAGAAVGAAIGARLTFAPVVVPLGGACLLLAIPWRERLRLAGAFAVGLAVLLLPVLWSGGQAPEAFFFDNFQFPRLRLLDPADVRVQKTMAWWRKLRFFVKEVAAPSWPLFLGYALLGARPAIGWWRSRAVGVFPAALILGTLPFLLFGCGVPSRYQYQHFFAFTPVLALGIAYGLQSGVQVRRLSGAMVAALLAVAGVGMAWFAPEQDSDRWMKGLVVPREWLPVRIHDEAATIRAHVPSGKVLTLGPILPLEAGLEIYPAFATGPFAWRGASLIDPARRQRLGFIGPDDLSALLAADPPAAVLTGFERKELERPLFDYAQKENLRPIPLKRPRILWVR